MQSLLSMQQKLDFERDGFLIIPDFIDSNTCETLIKRAQALIAEFDESSVQTVFSTINPKHTKENYFLDSANKIHFFFEENAFDQRGKLICDKSLAINKIGHGLHSQDPIFSHFSQGKQISDLLNSLNLINPLLIQSMYICKQPFIGGEVTCHQDSTFLFTQEHSVLGLWFALEDANLENGCLWAIPKGHKNLLKSRMRLNSEKNIVFDSYDKNPWDLTAMIPLEVKRGSVIVLHGLLPHMSKENTSAKSRHAYTLHVVPREHHYAEDNWNG